MRKPLPDESWSNLVTAVGRVEAAVGRALRRYGLGQSEFRALGRLQVADQHEIRLLDLADELALDRSSVSRLVTRLESQGLVHRESCGDDRRGVFTVLTDQGREIYKTAAPAYHQALADALAAADLPPDALAALSTGRT